MIEAKRIPLASLELNKGQIPGVPKNPWTWTKTDIKNLAASMAETPELIEMRGLIVYPHDGGFVVLGGNKRLEAAKENRWDDVPCYVLPEETPAEKLKEIVMKDNGAYGDVDIQAVKLEWADVAPKFGGWGLKFNLEGPAAQAAKTPQRSSLSAAEDGGPREKVKAVCAAGDIFQLGVHRLICGDSTKPETYERLLSGDTVDMVFADPPYGMKKESEGITNDNLNYDDLLAFNKLWIPLTLDRLGTSGSWYCWGTDEPLMDIYSEILRPLKKKGSEEKITFRNLLTWWKGEGGFGLGADILRQYFPHDEKCLFIMKGRQTYGDTKDDYWEGFEPIRALLVENMQRTGLSMRELIDVAGATSITHWFTKSQWEFPNEKRYKIMQANLRAKGLPGFETEYERLRAEFYKTRAYFDNTHDLMTSVWNFACVQLNEKQDGGGHASVKPQTVCQRAVRTSCPEGGSVLDPFGGSGSTLIACEATGRRAFLVELEPHWCDVIIDRWQRATGEKAVKI